MTANAAITDADFDLFLETTQPRSMSIKKGDFFCTMGQKQLQLAFVRKGLFKVFINTLDGSEYIKSFIDENRLMSSYSSIVMGIPANMNVQAIEDSDLYVMDAAKARSMMDKGLVWERIARKTAEWYFCEREIKELSHMTEDAETRYRRFVKQYERLLNRISQADIARYLGINPVSLSRIRGKSARKKTSSK